MQIGSLNSSTAVAALITGPVGTEQGPTVRQLVTAVRALNESELYGQGRQVQFTRDPGTRTFVIKVVNPDTGEVIDQIPPKELLQAFANLQELQQKKGNE